MKDAAEKDDAPDLREAAHKLAGIMAAFSTLAAKCASEVEELAAANRIDEFRPAVAQLEVTTEKLLQELDEVTISQLQKQAAAPPS